MKANARSYSHVYAKRGKLPERKACERCGSTEAVQYHHPDYFKPLLVEVVCTKCHRAEHAIQKQAAWNNRVQELIEIHSPLPEKYRAS